MSDVKFVWEAARHRDLVVLARAAAIEPNGPWLPLLDDMLRRWCLESAPEQGVNWYSSLELALRAFAWSQVLHLVGDRFAEDLRRDMDTQLVASARHIMLELPYTMSSMKNNHMLGDGLGLRILGRMFPTHPKSPRWRKVGDRLFLSQLKRHMRADGSMIEDSLSYHRFVLEMLTVRVLLGDAPLEVRDALRGASEHLRNLGALDGEIPQFGDWDEGRVLADSAPAGSVRGSVLLGLALADFDIPDDDWEIHDELAWYASPATRMTKELPPLPPTRVVGDWQVATRGDWVLWFKTGSGSSHQHADITSVFVRHGRTWIIRDPGTGTYNGPIGVRNAFRSSAAHPVWVPEGEDQLVPHRAFRWLRKVSADAQTPTETADATVMLAWHDAFRATHGCRVARAIVLTRDGITVTDAVEPPNAVVTWTMTVPMGDPEGELTRTRGLEDGTVVYGCVEPFSGWHSRTYGTWDPSQWCRLRSAFEKPFTWYIGQPIEGAAGTPVINWLHDTVRLSWDDGGKCTKRMEVRHG